MPETRIDTAVVEALRAAVPAATIEPGAADDMPTAYVDREHLVETCHALRDHPDLQFALLVDVVGVDYLPADPRFEIVYHLACIGPAYLTAGNTSAAAPRRFRLKVRLGAEGRIPTVTSIYPTANWLE